MSDNIGLAPPGGERTGLLLEVSPFVGLGINRPRLQASLAYSMRNFYTTPDIGFEGPRHELRALGNVALKDDWFWLAGQAQTFQVSRSPFVATAADVASRSGNRTSISRYDISPYVRGRIGQQTSYEAGYTFNAIQFGGGGIDSTANQVRARLENSPALNRLGWLVSADAGRREFDNGAEFDTANAVLSALYRYSSELRVGAGVSYTRISVVTDASGRNGGWGPTVSLRWTPSPRTSLDVTATRAYYGNAASARLSHLEAEWSFDVQYEQGIVDNAASGLNATGTGAPLEGSRQSQTGSVGGALDDRNGLAGFGSPFADGILSGALVETRLLGATAAWRRLRNSASISAFTSRSDSRQTNTALPSLAGGLAELDQRGVQLRYARLLSQQTSGILQGRFTHSETAGGSITTDLTIFDAVLSRQYSPVTTLSIGYRRSDQRGSAVYQENAILATARFRFQ